MPAFVFATSAHDATLAMRRAAARFWIFFQPHRQITTTLGISGAVHLALLLAFGRNGFLGQYLDQWFGITIPFTPAAVVMAETFVAMPFLVVTVEGALRSADVMETRGAEERFSRGIGIAVVRISRPSDIVRARD